MEKLGYYDLATIEYSFAAAIPAGFEKSWKTLTDYVKQLKKIFNPSTGAYKGLGGFISIGSIFPEEWSAQTFWNITAFLSIMLGFMNLLPIPALDGGHVVFTLWEMITGKKPGDNIREYADLEGRKVYRESVYSMDIPHDKLQPVKEYYGEEMGGLLGDLDGIGF